jgi:hypothetical protein
MSAEERRMNQLNQTSNRCGTGAARLGLEQKSGKKRERAQNRVERDNNNEGTTMKIRDSGRSGRVAHGEIPKGERESREEREVERPSRSCTLGGC